MIIFHLITPYCVSKQITYPQKMLLNYHSQTVMKTKYSTHFGHDKNVHLCPELHRHL